MTSDETQIYRRIISEQITLQELQALSATQNGDPLGVTRRIKHQRLLLSQLWETANALKN